MLRFMAHSVKSCIPWRMAGVLMMALRPVAPVPALTLDRMDATLEVASIRPMISDMLAFDNAPHTSLCDLRMYRSNPALANRSMGLMGAAAPVGMGAGGGSGGVGSWDGA